MKYSESYSEETIDFLNRLIAALSTEEMIEFVADVRRKVEGQKINIGKDKDDNKVYATVKRVTDRDSYLN